MEWSWAAWGTTVALVALSGAAARAEGHWRRRPGLDLGFADHGGMWGDALLLPVANALVVPWIPGGWWLAGPVLLAAAGAAALHAAWHGNTRGGFREHMWPTRPVGHWAADLSWAGWCHVAYVTAQVAVLIAYALVDIPLAVVFAVTAILTVHVPIGLLQPAWSATGRIPRGNVGMLVAAVTAIWVLAAVKAGRIADGF